MKTFIILILIFTTNLFADSPILLVGSTFDYAPLTYMENGQCLGSDIKIMQKFAKDNNYTLKFIVTTWQTLSKDLLDDKFCVAIGGISYDEERGKNFLLSNPISNFHKVALIRCDDIEKFISESSINTSKTRIVENIGGTNQKFAKLFFPNAKLILVENNQLPFSFLLKNQADVMFTDNIEAEYVQKINPKLCIAKIDTKYSSSNKVFLFNKTSKGAEVCFKFNKWWATHKNNLTDL